MLNDLLWVRATLCDCSVHAVALFYKAGGLRAEEFNLLQHLRGANNAACNLEVNISLKLWQVAVRTPIGFRV